VITVGSFHAGTADNVVPDEAHFLATVRSFSAVARDRVRAASLRLIADLAAAHGLGAEAEYLDGYPVTVNDADETAFAGQVVEDLFGADRLITQANPLPGAEDFSFVLDEVPGVFLMLGAGPEGSDPASSPFNHAADAVFDDAVLPDGAALLAELALRRLTAAAAPA
jgi:metal-dependent amidase/aminoacylase/carboxypeptidase family protein